MGHKQKQFLWTESCEMNCQPTLPIWGCLFLYASRESVRPTHVLQSVTLWVSKKVCLWGC